MIFENYAKNLLLRQIPSNKELYEIMYKVSDYISIGDNVETNIYTDQNWFLQNIHGFYTCVNTSYIINNTGEHNKPVHYELEFSADFNKTSSKKINKKKNIQFLQSKFKNKNIDDILYINKIFYELDKKKKVDIIKSLKKTYNLESKNILIALKIDKTNDKFDIKKYH